jgi:hypothetical protein
MYFKPTIKDSPRLMGVRLSHPEPMGLKEDLLICSHRGVN